MSILNNSIFPELVSVDMHYDTNHISDFGKQPPKDAFPMETTQIPDGVLNPFISPGPRTNQSLKRDQSCGSSILSEELWDENQKLRLMVKELKDLNALLQSQNTGYIEKLSEAMKDCFKAKLVAENLKQKYECIEKNEYYTQENSTLRIKMQQLEDNTNQHEILKEGQNADFSQLSDLKEELNKKAKCVKILENSSDALHTEISEENHISEKMKKHLKNNWTRLIQFGKKLNDMGLLTVKENKDLQKEYYDQTEILGSFQIEGHESIEKSFQDFSTIHIEDSNSCNAMLNYTRFGTTCHPQSSIVEPAQTLTGSPDEHDICANDTDKVSNLTDMYSDDELSDITEIDHNSVKDAKHSDEEISEVFRTQSDCCKVTFSSIQKVKDKNQFMSMHDTDVDVITEIYHEPREPQTRQKQSMVLQEGVHLERLQIPMDMYNHALKESDLISGEDQYEEEGHESIEKRFQDFSTIHIEDSNSCNAMLNYTSFGTTCHPQSSIVEPAQTLTDSPDEHDICANDTDKVSNLTDPALKSVQMVENNVQFIHPKAIGKWNGFDIYSDDELSDITEIDHNSVKDAKHSDEEISEVFRTQYDYEPRKPQTEQKQSMVLRECYVRLERLQIPMDMYNHVQKESDLISGEDQYEEEDDKSKILCDLPATSSEISNTVFARMGCRRLRNIDKLCYQKKFEEDVLLPFVQNSTGREVIIKQEPNESTNCIDGGFEMTHDHFNPAIADFPESDEDSLSNPITFEPTLHFYGEESENSSDAAECFWENENAHEDNPNNSFNAGWSEWIKTCKQTPPSRFVHVVNQRQTTQELPRKKQPKCKATSTQVKRKRKKLWSHYKRRKYPGFVKRLESQKLNKKLMKTNCVTKSNSQPVVSNYLELDSSCTNALIDPHQDSMNLEHDKEDKNQHFDPSSSDDSIDMCIRDFGWEISEIGETKSSESNIPCNSLHHEAEDRNHLLQASDSDDSIICAKSFNQEINELDEIKSRSKKELINPCQETLNSESESENKNHLSDSSDSDDSIDIYVKYFNKEINEMGEIKSGSKNALINPCQETLNSELESENRNHLLDVFVSDDSIDICIHNFNQEVNKIGKNMPESEEALIAPNQSSLHLEQILENRNQSLNTRVSDDCVDSCDGYFNKKVPKIGKNKSDSIKILDGPCQEALNPMCEIEEEKLSTVSSVSDSCDICIHTSNSLKTFINPSLQELNPLFERANNFKFKDISGLNSSLDDLEPEIEPNSTKELSMPCLEFGKPLQEKEGLITPMNDFEPEIYKIDEIEPNSTKELSMPCLEFGKPLQEEEDLNMSMNDLEPEISKIEEIEPNSTKELSMPCLEFGKPLQVEEDLNMPMNDLEPEIYKIDEIEPNSTKELSMPCLEFGKPLQEEEDLNMPMNDLEPEIYKIDEIEPNSTKELSMPCLEFGKPLQEEEDLNMPMNDLEPEIYKIDEIEPNSTKELSMKCLQFVKPLQVEEDLNMSMNDLEPEIYKIDEIEPNSTKELSMPCLEFGKPLQEEEDLNMPMNDLEPEIYKIDEIEPNSTKELSMPCLQFVKPLQVEEDLNMSMNDLEPEIGEIESNLTNELCTPCLDAKESLQKKECENQFMVTSGSDFALFEANSIPNSNQENFKISEIGCFSVSNLTNTFPEINSVQEVDSQHELIDLPAFIDDNFIVNDCNKPKRLNLLKQPSLLSASLPHMKELRKIPKQVSKITFAENPNLILQHSDQPTIPSANLQTTSKDCNVSDQLNISKFKTTPSLKKSRHISKSNLDVGVIETSLFSSQSSDDSDQSKNIACSSDPVSTSYKILDFAGDIYKTSYLESSDNKPNDVLEDADKFFPGGCKILNPSETPCKRQMCLEKSSGKCWTADSEDNSDIYDLNISRNEFLASNPQSDASISSYTKETALLPTKRNASEMNLDVTDITNERPSKIHSKHEANIVSPEHHVFLGLNIIPMKMLKNPGERDSLKLNETQCENEGSLIQDCNVYIEPLTEIGKECCKETNHNKTEQAKENIAVPECNVHLEPLISSTNNSDEKYSINMDTNQILDTVHPQNNLFNALKGGTTFTMEFQKVPSQWSIESDSDNDALGIENDTKAVEQDIFMCNKEESKNETVLEEIPSFQFCKDASVISHFASKRNWVKSKNLIADIDSLNKSCENEESTKTEHSSVHYDTNVHASDERNMGQILKKNNFSNSLKEGTECGSEFQTAAVKAIPPQWSTQSDSDDALVIADDTVAVKQDVFEYNKDDSKKDAMFNEMPSFLLCKNSPVIIQSENEKKLLKTQNSFAKICSSNDKSNENKESDTTMLSSLYNDTDFTASNIRSYDQIQVPCQLLKTYNRSIALKKKMEFDFKFQNTAEEQLSQCSIESDSDDALVIADDSEAMEQDIFECVQEDSKKDATNKMPSFQLGKNTPVIIQSEDEKNSGKRQNSYIKIGSSSDKCSENAENDTAMQSLLYNYTGVTASDSRNVSQIRVPCPILKKKNCLKPQEGETAFDLEFQNSAEEQISLQHKTRSASDITSGVSNSTKTVEQDIFVSNKESKNEKKTFEKSRSSEFLTNTLEINDSTKKEVRKRKLSISPESSIPNEQTSKNMKRFTAMHSNSTSPYNYLNASSKKSIENNYQRIQQENESSGKNISIHKAFMNIKDMMYSNLSSKKEENILFNVLIDPSNVTNNETLLFYVFRYLTLCKNNPLLVYDQTNNSSKLFPTDEACIIYVLFRIEEARKPHLQKLLITALNSIHEIVLAKTNINMLGLGSLCRVLTGICKRIRNPQKPLSLCCDLLKMKHKYAPFLIASIAGIWKELFQVSHNMSDEEVVFQSAIAFGACTRTTTFRLNVFLWKIIHKFLSQTLTAPVVSDITKTMDFLINRIKLKVINGSSPDYEYALMSPLVIFAVYSNWSWTKTNLLDIHIVPNLAKYGIENLNEKAFDVFCNIYAEIFPFSPPDQSDEVLIHFFEKASANKGDSFVRNCAAVALIKFLLARKSVIPSALQTWFERNRTSPKVVPLSLLFRRRKMSQIKLTPNDIL